MSEGDPIGGGDLDARLRRLFAGTDTQPDFDARLRARVAALQAAPAVPVADLRLRYERRQLEARERLRREAWLNTATAVGVGAAALALVWRHAPTVTDWVRSVLEAAGDGGSVTLAVLALGAALLWPLLQRPGGAGT